MQIELVFAHQKGLGEILYGRYSVYMLGMFKLHAASHGQLVDKFRKM